MTPPEIEQEEARMLARLGWSGNALWNVWAKLEIFLGLLAVTAGLIGAIKQAVAEARTNYLRAEAAGRLRERGVDASYLVVGGAVRGQEFFRTVVGRSLQLVDLTRDYESEAKDLVHDLRLDDVVRFVPFTQDTANLYQASDVVVAPYATARPRCPPRQSKFWPRLNRMDPN